ncbi:MAG: glycosyltransferase, partial [Rubrivivax sp.]|nr:glycosyltransferase [Rubrivivax sp.]
VVRRSPHYLRHAGRFLRVLAVRPPLMDVNPFAAPAAARGTLRLHPEMAGNEATIDAKVSVVIPTLNAGEELGWLLRKLDAQRAVREVEVVVVDSGSNDGTPTLARELGAKVVEITPAEFTHSHARNLGADAASGDYLLFMVQDAYPIGDLWLYGMLRYLLDHAGQGVVAASCAEYSRSDSDLMYDCNIATHYRFLGCLDADRIGAHIGDDHMALRSMGQLSDVSCLIARPLFMRHRYRGDYAEDLDLGIRLIRDGHKVAMLASVKVIHSHNRPAFYYLKRSFVDVIFLVGLFDDFHCPPCESMAGLADGARFVAVRLTKWLAAVDELADGVAMDDQLARWMQELRNSSSASASVDGAAVATGDERVDAFLAGLATLAAPLREHGSPAAAQREHARFVDSFMARAEHFRHYLASVHGPADARVRREVADAMRKTLASTLGAALAFLYLDRKSAPEDDGEKQLVGTLFRQLRAGV